MYSDTNDATVLVTIVDRIVERGDGESPAIWTDAGAVSYCELARLVETTAWRLRALGVRTQDRVVVELEDTVELVAAFLGAIRIGAVPVLINPWAKFSSYAVAHSGARLLISDHRTGSEVGCEVISGPELTTPAPLNINLDSSPAAVHSEDQAFWLYSSGSTGHPKAVVHLHRDVAGVCTNYAGAVLGLTQSDRCFSTAKLFHAYGLGGGLLFPLWHGASVTYLQGKPAPSGVLDAIERAAATVLFSVPALYNALARHSDSIHSVSSLRLCVSAAEPLAPAVWERWREKTGLEILDGVGSTEMLHIYCSNRPGAVVAGSAGVPVPGYELQLRANDTDDSEPQEMWVRGPSTFDRYWHNQQATRDVFFGQWFRTGDCFRLDEDGNYWYLGRVDDMLKISGIWISANSIEARLTAHPMISDNAVISVAVGGMNRIKAFVVADQALAPDQQRSVVAELRRWCAQGLPADHVPHYFELVDALPKTAAGKVQRFALRANATAAQRSGSRVSSG